MILAVLLSTLSPEMLKRFFILCFSAVILLMLYTLLWGAEVKGAKRWIYILGISIQPSEFAKPCFSVINAMFLSLQVSLKCKIILSFALYMGIAFLMILQPDFGMSVVLGAIWCGQIFMSELPMKFIILIGCLLLIGALVSFVTFPHIQNRFYSFLNPEQSENFQINKSLEAFGNGGVTGVGLGNGSVKNIIPDAHTDFIFAVAGEELGGIFCVIILLAFLFIIMKSIKNLAKQNDKFMSIAGYGLILQLTMQVIINVSVTLNLLPTKGMTLPFISYGGSSALANGLVVGALLSLTRTRYNT